MNPYVFPEVPNATVGALLIGLTVSSFLYGVTCAQTSRFYQLFPTELWYLKLVIFLLWLTETANMFMTTHALYYYVILKSGDYSTQFNLVWSIWLASGTNSLSGTIVQLYYSRRLYIISHNRVIPISICFLSVAQTVLSWFLVFIGILHPEQVPHYRDIVTTNFSVVALVDILVTASLAYYLQLRKTGLIRTRDIVNAIMLHVVGCGALSSAISVGGLITYVTMSKRSVGLAFCFVLGKAYANSVLSSLNARASRQITEARISMTDHFNMSISANSNSETQSKNATII